MSRLPRQRQWAAIRFINIVLAIILVSAGFRAVGRIHLISIRPQEIALEGDVTQDERDVRPLEPLKPIEREIAAGGLDSFRIRLVSGEYLRTTVDQRGIDIVVSFFDPQGSKIVEVDISKHSREAQRFHCWLRQRDIIGWKCVPQRWARRRAIIGSPFRNHERQHSKTECE